MFSIRALADLHGWLPEIEPCDLLLIAGDVCPIEDHCLERQFDWLAWEFREWLENLPAKEIVGIAGNHDFVFQKWPDDVGELELPWTYLEDSGTELRGYKIWGSPWVPNLPNWAFYGDDATLTAKVDLIPDDTDILVTHGPPHGYGDKVGGWDEVGSSALTSASIYRVQPKLHVFGHIHEGRGLWKVPTGELANVAMVDEHYNHVHQPMEFTWNVPKEA